MGGEYYFFFTSPESTGEDGQLRTGEVSHEAVLEEGAWVPVHSVPQGAVLGVALAVWRRRAQGSGLLASPLFAIARTHVCCVSGCLYCTLFGVYTKGKIFVRVSEIE